MTRVAGEQLAFDLTLPVVRCWICCQHVTAEPLPARPGYARIGHHLHPRFPGVRCIGGRQLTRPDRDTTRSQP